MRGAFGSLGHCMETYMGAPREAGLSDEIREACRRNIVRNIRAALKNPKDIAARRELIWAAAMTENSVLEIGSVTDIKVMSAF